LPRRASAPSCHCSTEKDDQLPPAAEEMLARIAVLSAHRIRLLHRKGPTWPTTDMGQRRSRVQHAKSLSPAPRFRPRFRCDKARTLCAIRNCREHVQQPTLIYSITSSARPSSAAGAVSPSAFAVLRLITRSYLVGACTGRSAASRALGYDRCRLLRVDKGRRGQDHRTRSRR
jgi:hypothetical protein